MALVVSILNEKKRDEQKSIFDAILPYIQANMSKILNPPKDV